MKSPIWTLRIDMRAVRRVKRHVSDDFVDLVFLAGLDPSRDLRHISLVGIDCRNCDLSGFNFTGSDLNGAKFRGALIAGAVFDRGQRKMPELVGAKDYAAIYGSIPPEFRFSSRRRQGEEFLEAASAGDLEALRAHIATGMGLDEEVRIGVANRTPLVHVGLHAPAYLGRAAIGGEFLLRAGADPNYALSDGFTALHAAVGNQERSLVRTLLRHGANPNARAEDGRTPLGMAIAQDDRNLVTLLKRHGGTELNPSPEEMLAIARRRYGH